MQIDVGQECQIGRSAGRQIQAEVGGRLQCRCVQLDLLTRQLPSISQLLPMQLGRQPIDGNILGEVGANPHGLSSQLYMSPATIGVEDEVAIQLAQARDHLPAVPSQIVQPPRQQPATIRLLPLEGQILQFAGWQHLVQGLGTDALLSGQQRQYRRDAGQANGVDATTEPIILRVQLNMPGTPDRLITSHLEIITSQLPAAAESLPLQQTAT